jgi:hypothetical protein|tara:strand:+ start:688 stop:795 length:108 start_codon:yes stop_codon:yes gene_type:complete
MGFAKLLNLERIQIAISDTAAILKVLKARAFESSS